MMVSNESFYGISDTLVDLNLMGLQPHAFEVSCETMNDLIHMEIFV